MTKLEFQRFGLDLANDLQQATIWWQIGVLVIAFVIAYAVRLRLKGSLRARQQASRAASIAVGWGSVNRALMPLTAAAVIFVGKEILERYQSVALLKLALPLICYAKSWRQARFWSRRSVSSEPLSGLAWRCTSAAFCPT